MDGSLSEDKKLKAMLVNAGVLIPLKKYDQMTMIMIMMMMMMMMMMMLAMTVMPAMMVTMAITFKIRMIKMLKLR